MIFKKLNVAKFSEFREKLSEITFILGGKLFSKRVIKDN